MTIKGNFPPSADGNFRVVNTIGVPHPYCIGTKLVSYVSDHWNGMITETATEDAEKHGIFCDICQKSLGQPLTFKEHKQGLLIECKTEINVDKKISPALQEYLFSIKEEAEKNGYEGFAFKKYGDGPKYSGMIVSGSMGSFMDPPGHPDYFYHVKYDHGSETSMEYAYKQEPGYWDDITRERLDWYFADWHAKKPPLDHPRTIAWMIDLFNHLHHCYRDASKPDHDNTLIFPVPSYKLKHFHDDPRFSEEWREKEKAVIEQANAEIVTYAQKIATVDNHQAVMIIRKYYPDFKPNESWLDNPPEKQGYWYGIRETRPTPKNCPGEKGIGEHPVNGSWCQFCGWHADDDNAPKKPK